MVEPGDEPSESGTRRETRRPRRTVGLDKIFETLQPAQAEPERAKTLLNSLGMSFVLLPAGSFLMGSPDTEIDHRTNESPVHEVVLGNSFYLGMHPVTQKMFQRVLGRNPSRFRSDQGGSPDHPVEMVSWNDAVLFCEQLSRLAEEGHAGRSYRLPTEAEWEYACRAGKVGTPFGHGEQLNADHGNFDASHPYGVTAKGRRSEMTSPVNRYPANAWGLHDLHGNVWEWCADWYFEGYYRTSPTRDPGGPSTGQLRVLRGGSWRSHGSACRAAYRNALAPHQRDSATSFRIVAMMGASAG